MFWVSASMVTLSSLTSDSFGTQSNLLSLSSY